MRLKRWQLGAVGLLIMVMSACVESPAPSDSQLTSSSARSSESAASPARRLLERVVPAAKGAELGMSLDALRRARPSAAPEPDLDSETHFALREGLGKKGALLYLFGKDTQRLERLQATQGSLKAADIAPRLKDDVSRFGTPAGAWDCPAIAGSLPTRRYVWREGDVAWMESFLLVGEQVGATLYLSAREIIRQSLADARCVPTPAERAALFPTLPSDPRAIQVSAPAR